MTVTVTMPCDLSCEFCGVWGGGGYRGVGLAGPPQKRSVMSSPNVASMSGDSTKERHDRVLYVLVKAIMRALGFHFLSPYKTLVGCAKPGVYGTDETMVMVDQVYPTDHVVTEARPDMVVRLDGAKRQLILEVVCAWEPQIMAREIEVPDPCCSCSSWGSWHGGGRLRQHLRDSKLMKPTEVDGLVRSLKRETLCGCAKLLKRHFTL